MRIIYDDQESDAALTHVPKGRDALLILAFARDNPYNIRITEERTALSEHTIDPCSIVAADGQPLLNSHWIMKNLDHDDREQCESETQAFAEHFFKHIDKGISHDKRNKCQPEQEQSSETKKRRRSTDHDEESMSAREDRSVKVKVKVIVEPPNPANVAEFNQEFQDIYLGREMSKTDAAKELDEIKQAFTEFMERYHMDPKKAHKDLTDCELRFLAHVNPDENIEGDEFYFEHASDHPTMEEFRAAQNPSGYLLRLPIGLKKLKNRHDPELIKSFTNILGSLMQGTDGQVVDYLKRKDYPSSISPNILTVNHGNLTTSPKLDSRELKSWPIKHRRLIMQMMQNSAHILCINEADASLYPEEVRPSIASSCS